MTEVDGKVRFVPIDDPRVPPAVASRWDLQCNARLSNEVLRVTDGWVSDNGCPTPVDGECPCDARCSRPPHDPSEVHASHGALEAVIWGGE